MFETTVNVQGVSVNQVCRQVNAMLEAHQFNIQHDGGATEAMTIDVCFTGHVADVVLMACALGAKGFSIDDTHFEDFEHHMIRARITLPEEIPF